MSEIRGIAIASGVVVLGGAHLAIWLLIRSNKKSETKAE